jgi:hypothetical protein
MSANRNVESISYPVLLTLIWMAIKKCMAVQLVVIYDSQAANRKQGGLLVRALLSPAALLLVAWESYVYDTQPARIHKNTTKNR